jgi:hypothetical protein
MTTTYDGSTEKVFINGVLDKSHAMTSSTPVSVSNTVSLGFMGDASENMDADIGLLLIYNRTLTAAEVTTLYSTYSSRFMIGTVTFYTITT